MGDKTKGLYNKFKVERRDGHSLPGGKHADCSYFVLDLNHDPHAIPALSAYAQHCRLDGYEKLADDLEQLVAQIQRGEGTAWP